MLQIREIMTTDVLALAPEMSVREAMELLGRAHVSGAPVLSGGKVVGIVSATDLMSFAATLSGVPTQRDVRDEWDEYPEPSIEEDVEDERVAPSASFAELWDDVGADVTQRMANVQSPEWNALEEYDVSDIMTRPPLTTLPPDATAELAAELMKRHDVHRVLVVDGDALVGIVTSLDITRAAAEHKLGTRTYAFNHDRDFEDHSSR